MRMLSIRPQMPWDFAFFASETALTLRAYGVYYRFNLLFSRFFHSYDNTVYFRVTLHNMYYQNYR